MNLPTELDRDEPEFRIPLAASTSFGSLLFCLPVCEKCGQECAIAGYSPWSLESTASADFVRPLGAMRVRCACGVDVVTELRGEFLVMLGADVFSRKAGAQFAARPRRPAQ